MSKSASGVTLPHLTPQELIDRDSEENLLKTRLRACLDREDFDSERAMHVLHSGAIDIFKVMNLAYLRRPQYKPEWKEEIISTAVFRALYSSFDYVSKYAHQEYRDSDDPTLEVAEELKQAIREHVEATASHFKPAFTSSDTKKHPSVFESLTGKEAASYARAGIDIASASPLLLMAHAALDHPASETASPIGDQLRILRQESGFTTEEIAEKIGINVRHVYKHLAGTVPRAKHIRAYEEVFTAALGRTVKLKRQ
ncbi:helix-turn-helix domain-containing protein [Acidicapsa dinghuensis]|uniref:Helix-turn-helix domain-containing protein n=1 Tax=Acidicapsa dinghuensis TaxID=2218256 RepID=A0ABW1EMX8_9BACT|nr:helix-turn-helix transcriptional regulator [Acidicapsa dinghuensis]